MKPIWWLPLIALGIVFYVMGDLNWQVSHFVRFMWIFLSGVFAMLLLFVYFLRKNGKS